MVLLLLLIISLAFVMVFLHFNKPGIIQHHVVALVSFSLFIPPLSRRDFDLRARFQFASWPIALGVIVGGVATGAPFLVGLCLLLYFSSLLPFAYIYNEAKWTTSIDPPLA